MILRGSIKDDGFDSVDIDIEALIFGELVEELEPELEPSEEEWFWCMEEEFDLELT